LGCFCCVLTMPRPPRSTPFPYTTLFRSGELREVLGERLARHRQAVAVERAPVEQHLQHRRRAADRVEVFHDVLAARLEVGEQGRDRKSTRLNSSHVKISYAVFCLKKKII